jgi:hypothetical protein
MFVCLALGLDASMPASRFGNILEVQYFIMGLPDAILFVHLLQLRVSSSLQNYKAGTVFSSSDCNTGPLNHVMVGTMS